MPTRNIVLTDHQSLFVEELVSSGRYQNASEVLREGLRLVQDREAENAAKLLALKAMTAKGVADVQAGRVSGFDTESTLNQHLEALRQKALSTELQTK